MLCLLTNSQTQMIEKISHNVFKSYSTSEDELSEHDLDDEELSDWDDVQLDFVDEMISSKKGFD